MQPTAMCFTLATLTVLASCGRIGFGESAPSDGSAGASSDGARSDASGDALAVCATGTVELCNGIDDDCDGLVDEGCPCTAGSAAGAVQMGNSLVSFGAGLGTTSGGGHMYTPIDVDGALGTMQSPPDFTEGWSRQSLAWDGERVAYVATPDTGPRTLVWLNPDGTTNATGPSLGTSGAADVMLRWNGSGYDIAIADAAANMFTVLATDASGTPLPGAVSVPTTGPQMPRTIALVTRSGHLVIVWLQPMGNSPYLTLSEVNGGALATLSSTKITNSILGDAASDGTHILLAFNQLLYVFDDSGRRTLAITLPGEIIDDAWTGESWYVVSADDTDDNLYLSHFDTTFALLGTETLQGAGDEINMSSLATIAADRRRVDVVYSWGLGPTFTSGFWQRCVP